MSTGGKQRPNILWILSDQHNADCLGVANHPDVRTPHLDALAREGIHFRQAFCNNPICAPSRACFLTGQYVHTHGVSGNDIYETVQSHPTTVATRFRGSGYQSALIGKGHLPKTWMEDGFEYRRYCDLADGERNDPRTVPYFRYLIEHGLGDAYDLGKLPPEHPGARMRAFTSALPYQHSVEHWTGDEALRFLRERDQERPFFLQLSFQRPHDPFSPSPESMELYDPETIHLPSSARDYFENQFASKPQFQRRHVSAPEKEGYPYRPHDQADLKRQMAHHFALITVIDEQIGRVLGHLRATGEYENTVICYHADHGDFAGQHGLTAKNFGLYESIHRIPFLLRYPGGPSGKVCDALIESVDLCPTFCALAGLPPPEGAEGRSLASVVEGHAPEAEEIVCEHDTAQRTAFALRTKRYRLVHYGNAPSDGELYDRQDDPDELHNLYRHSEMDGVRADLLARLLGHVGRCCRTWSPRNDAAAAAKQPSFTKLIHKRHIKWSQIAPFFES